MGDRMRNSWILMKSSLRVMMLRKKLLLFPLVTVSFMLLIGLFFITPIALQPTGFSYTSAQHWATVGASLGSVRQAGLPGKGRFVLSEAGWTYYGILYLVVMFLSVFFNTAFYSEIMRALRGEEVSVTRGLRFALKKIRPILYWSLFAGLVGMLIRNLEEKFGFIGKMVVALIGVAWSVSSIFVIPALIRQEETNPLKILRTSAATLKRTWGEAAAGFLGMSAITLLPFIAVIAAVLAGVVLKLPVLLIMIIALGGFAAEIGVMYLSQIAGHIYKCALYLFAFENYIPEPYTEDMMRMAWRYRKRRD